MFNQKKFDRDFNIIELMFKIMFPIVFIAAIAIFAFNIWFGVKTYQAVDQHGLKAIVERVWEGPNGTIR